MTTTEKLRYRMIGNRVVANTTHKAVKKMVLVGCFDD